MKVRPVGERVLVIREEIEEKSTGGIIMSQTKQEQPNQGEVVAVGDSDAVAVGDTVIYAKYSDGDAIHVGENIYHILDVKDIKAVIYS